MEEEKLVLKDGNFEVIHRNKEGNVVHSQKFKNIQTNTCKQWRAKVFNGVSVEPFDYVAIGTGTTAALVTDTTLETIHGAKALGTTSYEADYKAVIAKTFNFVGDVNVTEAGLLDASDHLCARQVFAAEVMAAGESLEVRWTGTFS